MRPPPAVSMREDRRVARLVRHVYRAALDAPAWSDFLTESGRLFDSHCTWLMVWDPSAHASSVSWAGGEAGPEAMRQYNAYYGTVNPLVRRHATQFMRAGVVNVSQARMPVADFLKTEFYNDFCRPLDVLCAAGACVSDTHGVCVHVSWLRSGRSGLFGDHEVRQVSAILSHLRRALRVHGLLQRNRAVSLASERACHASGAAVLHVTPNRRVLWCSAQAEELLRTTDDLRVIRGQLEASRQTSLLLRAAMEQARTEGHVSAPVTLRQPSGDVLNIVCVPASLASGDAGHVGMVLVLTTSRAPRDLAHLLRTRFGFTSQQATVAALLAEGHSLAEASDRLRLSKETLRSHLKVMFRKASVNRQADLVSLCLRSRASG